MGLYKNEAVAKNSPFITGPLKTLADVEKLTFDWLERGINVNYDLARHYRTWLDQQSATITT
ncbi:hypothetical protein [Cryobacterium sp. N19]|nr:hypothetical protein [Cryobacterium sp. N19]